MKQKRALLIIIFFISLIHFLMLLFFLVFYHIPQFPYFTAAYDNHAPEHNNNDQVETVFYDDWAELKPQAGSLSASLPTDEINNFELPDVKQTMDDQDQHDAQPTETQDALTQENEFKQPDQLHDLSAMHIKKQSAIQKREAQKALASITKGYLEQLKQEGTNLIKTIGGNENKLPTELQLKYERYMAKLQWSFQNAHSIHIEKLAQRTLAIQSTMKVSLAINRTGKMTGLKMLQSSGNNFVDAYILNLFEYASSSFPPLPQYIKEDPYCCVYIIFIDWNSKASPYVCFTRN